MEVAQRIPGFDVVMMGHDHRRYCGKVANIEGDSVLLINPASNGRVVGSVDVVLKMEHGKVLDKQVSGVLTDVDKLEPSKEFMEKFAPQYKAVNDFVSEKVGTFTESIATRPAYFGPSAFIDFIHSLQLELTGADVSFAAPLSFDAKIDKGDITISDMFSLYKYENMLYTMNLTGAEIKGFGYLALLAAAVLAIIYGAVRGHVFFVVLGVLYVSLGWIALCGLRILKPQEALVLTLFGKYIGTLKGEGFYYVNPFCSAVNPAANTKLSQSGDVDGAKNGIVIAAGQTSGSIEVAGNKKISLKIMTLNNSRQKINDCLGNPVEIGIAVMWRVVDTAKAVFDVDNYKEYLSLQCDSALRNIVRIYPYDVAPNVDTTGDGVADEGSLRGSSEIVAERIRKEIQQRVDAAGIEIIEARITYLAYATEIAAVMLQRQQASAIIDARKMIVDGAVGMVEMALERLSENNVVALDDERKAAMVSNLLVVLCGNRDAQPVVNSGSLY